MATQNPYSDSLLMDAFRGSLSNAESLGRGFAVAPVGLFGDVNALARQYITPRLPSRVQGLLQAAPAAPTTEQILSNIPRASAPRMESSGMEQLGAAMNPRGPVELARGAERAAMAAGRAGERYAERVVPQIMERGGMPAQLMQDLAQGSIRPMDVYHGSTNKELTQLNPKKSFGNLGVSWVSPEEEFAKRYAGKEGRVYKLDLNEGKNFDFANQEQLDLLKEKAKSIDIYDPIRGSMTLDKRVPDSGSYYSAEDPQLFNLIKKMGFDSVSVYEDGVRNIGVFNPKKNIKFIDESSAEGLLGR